MTWRIIDKNGRVVFDDYHDHDYAVVVCRSLNQVGTAETVPYRVVDKPTLTPDELGAYADLARDERSPFPSVATCAQCGAQIMRDDHGTWCDNSGGDVCGVLGGNEPHRPEGEPWHAAGCTDPECFGDCHRWPAFDAEHADEEPCGACGGWHTPRENCDLDDIVAIIDAQPHEGWAIFECWGSDNGPFQIQKFDVPDDFPGALVWENDLDVVEWLYFRMMHGDPVAARALTWVSRANPKEGEYIRRWMITGPRVEL